MILSTMMRELCFNPLPAVLARPPAAPAAQRPEVPCVNGQTVTKFVSYRSDCRMTTGQGLTSVVGPAGGGPNLTADHSNLISEIASTKSSIFLGVRAVQDGERLPVRLGREFRRAGIGNPNLDKAAPGAGDVRLAPTRHAFGRSASTSMWTALAGLSPVDM